MKGEILVSEKAMVAGAGENGIAATKLTLEMGDEVLLYDDNKALSEEKIRGNFPENTRLAICLDELDETLLISIQICVMNPGTDLEAPSVRKLTGKKIQLRSEIGLGFQVVKERLLTIIDTNGKTTTTVLTGTIMQHAFGDSFTVGDIGLSYTEVALKTTEKLITVLEASSFQLETIIHFRSHVTAITSIISDHLSRHHTMENYVQIEEDVNSNQTADDFLALNYDGEMLRAFSERKDLKPKVVFFSSTQLLDDGYDLEDGIICHEEKGEETELIRTDRLQLLGRHNPKNVMAVITMAACMKTSMDAILDAVRKFRVMEHRIEFVAERYDVKYYNDSKGTNPGAAIQAIKAMPGPTLLIGGDYDKGPSYNEWIDTFSDKVRYLVLLGQTCGAISDCAKRYDFTSTIFTEDIQEAVKVYVSYTNAGGYVLFSSTCTSQDMFPNYEVCGKVFKECVCVL